MLTLAEQNTLNQIGENIFIADLHHKLVWMNSYAQKLMDSLAPNLHIANHSDLLGRNIASFHRNPAHQETILNNGPFPHHAKIRFLSYTANISVTQFKDGEGHVKGYLLVWKDVTTEEKEMQSNLKLIEEMSAPIISTIFSDVLLVPLTGILTRDRMNLIQTKVLEACSEKGASYVLFDFTGITGVMDDVLDIFAIHLEDVRKMLQLLGTKCIYAGFSPLMVQNLVRSGIDPQVKTLGLFHQAMNYVIQEKGYIVRKKSTVEDE